MMTHPELLLALGHERQRELAAEADRAHVLRSARRVRTPGRVTPTTVPPTRHTTRPAT